eukprot:gene12836-12964_t
MKPHTMPMRYSRLSSGGGGPVKDVKENKLSSSSASDLPDTQPCCSVPPSSKKIMLHQDQQQLQQQSWEEATPAAYHLWRSRQLLALDVHFCVLYICTHIIYGVKTAKSLCPRVMKAGGSSISGWAAAMLCTTANNIATTGMTQVLVSPALTSLIMLDWGVGLSIPGLALWALMLTVPALMKQYTRKPWLRVLFLLAQRSTKLTGLLICMWCGGVKAEYLDLALQGYYMTLGQHVFDGWQAAMTVVPLRVQLVFGLVEWGLACWVIRNVVATYPQTVSQLGYWGAPVNAAAAFIFGFVAPTAVSAVVEARHRRGYERYLARLTAVQQQHAATPINGQQALHYNSWQLADHVENDDENRCCRAVAQPSSKGEVLEEDDATASGGSNSSETQQMAVQDQQQLLQEPVSFEQHHATQQVLDLAAGAVDLSEVSGLLVPRYRGHCKMDYASVKVAASHNDITTLGPLLHASLVSALNCSSPQPAVCQSVAFEGCVQLLGLVYKGPGQQLEDAAAFDTPYDTSQSQVSNSAAAGSLLAQVQRQLAAAGELGRIDSGNCTPDIPKVTVVWSGAAAAAAAVGTGTQSWMRGGFADGAMQQQAAATSCPEPTPQLPMLLYCDPAVVSSGAACTLQLKLVAREDREKVGRCTEVYTALQYNSLTSTYRLLVFQHQSLLWDQPVRLSPSAAEPDLLSASVSLPDLTPGVVPDSLAASGGTGSSLNELLDGTVARLGNSQEDAVCIRPVSATAGIGGRDNPCSLLPAAAAASDASTVAVDTDECECSVTAQCSGEDLFMAAYVEFVSQQTLAADVIGAVYYVWLVIALRLLTEQLQYKWNDGPALVLWEASGRVLAAALFCLPSVLLVLFRQQLVGSGR